MERAPLGSSTAGQAANRPDRVEPDSDKDPSRAQPLADSLPNHLMGNKIKICTGYNDGHSNGRSQVDGTDCFGQLVLNVDFAPPREDGPHELAKAHHLIEVSLGIKQTTSNDLESGQSRFDSDQASTPAKTRLVYERIDRFPLELSESRLLAGLGSSEPAGGLPATADSLTWKPGPLASGSQQNGFALPFKSNSFDACFCFNLLNVRLASQRLLSLECDEPDTGKDSVGIEQSGLDALKCPDWAGSLEFDWLKMSRLTNELRLQILRELSRVVKARGK